MPVIQFSYRAYSLFNGSSIPASTVQKTSKTTPTPPSLGPCRAVRNLDNPLCVSMLQISLSYQSVNTTLKKGHFFAIFRAKKAAFIVFAMP
jgi:hypothetical protein